MKVDKDLQDVTNASTLPRQQKCHAKLDAGGDTHSRAHGANVLGVTVYLHVVVSAMCLYEQLCDTSTKVFTVGVNSQHLAKKRCILQDQQHFLEMTKVENGVQGLFEGDSSRIVEYY